MSSSSVDGSGDDLEFDDLDGFENLVAVTSQRAPTLTFRLIQHCSTTAPRPDSHSFQARNGQVSVLDRSISSFDVMMTPDLINNGFRLNHQNSKI